MDWYTHFQYIPDELTHLEEAEAAYGLREAWKNIVGSYPDDRTVALLWSQTALETGRWKSMHCYNWGNIKKMHSPDDTHYFTMFRCSEVLNGKEIWFDPPHDQTHFRAYKDVVSGAEDYLRLLKSKKRYQLAWQALLTGDPVLFVLKLRQGGYFTANLERYTKAVVSLTNEFMRRKKELLSWEPPIEPVTIDEYEEIPDTDPSPPPAPVKEELDSDPLPITNPDPEPELNTSPIPGPPDFWAEDTKAEHKTTAVITKKNSTVLFVLVILGMIATWFHNCFGC